MGDDGDGEHGVSVHYAVCVRRGRRCYRVDAVKCVDASACVDESGLHRPIVAGEAVS